MRDETRARVIAVRHQTNRSVTLLLAPNARWKGLRAGQFVNVSVEIDGVRHTRPYSPAGSQQRARGELELTVSTHPFGLVSGHLRTQARPGMLLTLSKAAGEFVLPERLPDRIALISGGSGITPVLAQLRTLCELGYDGQIAFINYARSARYALYRNELAQLERSQPQLKVLRSYTRGRGGTLQGRFCAAHLRAALPQRRGAAIFVCGPPALIEAVQATCRALRLAPPRCESFAALGRTLPRSGTAARGARRATITLARSDRQLRACGLPLLEQLEDAGLAPPFGCRMGICNTCATRKHAGVVRNIVTGARSGSEEELVRLCVSVPEGDLELDL